MAEPNSDAEKVRRLLESMVEIDEDVHDDFLREQAGEDNRLRQFVESVVQVDSDGEDESGGGLIDRVLRKDTPQAIVGQTIGGYEILELLGVEGMASVFAARLAGGPKVRLSLMRLGLTTAPARARFEVLTEALVGFRHPGFQPILAVGSWEEPNSKQHLPWFVTGASPAMRAFDRVVVEDELSLEGLLDRFLQVLDAVHVSHQRGILHRQLAPTTVRFGAEDRLQIFENGIAHATRADVIGVGMHARTGDVLRTTRYFAPEQLAGEGEGIDTRTDVFALGVMLFDLLSGEAPYPVEGAPAQRAAAMRAATPPRPGRQRKPFGRRRADLDTIVQRAIAGDPDLRYGSVAELAADLRRYREDQPLAGAANRWDEGKRFLRRHRFLIGAALAAMLVLSAGIVLLALRSGQLEEARTAERAQVERGDRIRELIDPAIARPGMSVRASLDMLRDRVDTLRDAPRIEAAARLTLGRALGAQGDLDAAMAQIGRAHALLEKEYGADHLETLRAIRARALVQAAQGKSSEAAAALRDGLARLQANGAEQPHEVALFRFHLADRAIEARDYEAADAALMAAIAAWRAEANRDRELATALARQGDLYRAMKNPEAAIRNYREAHGVLAKRQDSRTVLSGKIDRSLGDLHAERGAHRAATERYGAAAAQFARTLGEDSRACGLARLRQAQSLAAEFEFRQAREVLERALPACNFHLQGEEEDLIAARLLMSQCLRAEARGTEAVTFARAAFAGAVARHGVDAAAIAPAADELGRSLRDAGDLKAAEAHFRKRLAARENQPENLDRKVRILRAKNDLATVLLGRKQRAAALKMCEEVLAEAPEVLPPDHPLWSALLQAHGRSLAAMENYEKSEHELVEALTRAQRAFGPEHEQVRSSLQDLIDLYDAWGRPQDAENYRKRLGGK